MTDLEFRQGGNGQELYLHVAFRFYKGIWIVKTLDIIIIPPKIAESFFLDYIKKYAVVLLLLLYYLKHIQAWLNFCGF